MRVYSLHYRIQRTSMYNYIPDYGSDLPFASPKRPLLHVWARPCRTKRHGLLSLFSMGLSLFN